MAAKKTFPIKLNGSISWISGTDDDEFGRSVKRGIFRSSNEIVLHCEYGGWQYDISLKRTTGYRFEGEFHAHQGQRTVPITASGTLYSNEEGYLLFGKWLEEGYEYIWWAELRPVDHFDDESQD